MSNREGKESEEGEECLPLSIFIARRRQLADATERGAEFFRSMVAGKVLKQFGTGLLVRAGNREPFILGNLRPKLVLLSEAELSESDPEWARRCAGWGLFLEISKRADLVIGF